MTAREAALDGIMAVLEEGSFTQTVLLSLNRKFDHWDRQDKALMNRLIRGTVEKCVTVDAVLDAFSSVPVKKQKPVIRNILRMGVYELLALDRIPSYVVVSEAVNLTKKRGLKGLSGFVNAVLRKIASSPEKVAKVLSVPHVKAGCPLWLYESLLPQYGEALCGIFSGSFLSGEESAVLTLRVNRSKASVEDVVKALTKEGKKQGMEAVVSPHPFGEDLLSFKAFGAIEDLGAYQKGEVMLQDAGAALIARAAMPAPGMKVLDVCGAPGGKSIAVCDAMKDQGSVLCMDLSKKRLSMAEEQIRRTGFTAITTKAGDASVLDPALLNQFDIVIADLPCSGLGVIGKKPDVLRRLKPEDLTALAALQRRILSVVWQYVKPGGVLLYSTCTIRKEENEDQVSWLLEQAPFTLSSFADVMPEELKKEAEKGMLQLLPRSGVSHGFFMARLCKKETV